MSTLARLAKPCVETAARACGFSYGELMRRGRKQPVAEARFAAMLALYRAGWSFPAIAEATGRDDHTTAINGVEKALALEASDPGFAACVRWAEAVAPQPTRKTNPRGERVPA